MATQEENFTSSNDAQDDVEPKPVLDNKVIKDERTVEADNDNGNDRLHGEKGDDSKAEPDEYNYTKREGFTSEIFKISVTNLPKKFGFAEFKKRLIQLDLKPVKLKIWKEICFVTFRNEEDRESALKTIDGYRWKGRELKAVTARPAADPLMRKRKLEQNQSDFDKDGKKAKEDDGLSPAERLKNSVTPLWKMSYDEQLIKKQEDMKTFMKKYLREMEKNCPDLRRELHEWRREFGGMPCELQMIKLSPETEGYRNKCEFTIGPGIDGQTNVVGFRFGQYSQGTVYVGSPEEVNFLSDTMKTVVKGFQTYLSQSSYREFNPENHTGHWRQLAVRTTRLGHIMIMIDFHPQSLSQEDILQEQKKICEYFSEGDGKACGITSCYFRVHSERMTGAPSDSPYKLIFGNESITERLLDMEFRISPNAFFQVNTSAAEGLYKQAAEWCNISPSSTVLDVCCGTGTIGLTVAKTVEKVIGIEMCSEAIQDAKFNAEKNDDKIIDKSKSKAFADNNLNINLMVRFVCDRMKTLCEKEKVLVTGLENVKFHCAKAEDVMKDITKTVRFSSDVVAVVDPPRSGLHSSVVVAIRNCHSINRLVYVSCNVNGALNNMIDLVRPTSKRLKGSRFLPVKAVPVDLFPHTNHCELVVLFEREKSDRNVDDSD